MGKSRVVVKKPPNEPVPFFAVGNAAVGVIAIGNVAFGVVAIGMSLSCGVVAIGMNSVGVISLGLNAAGPFAAALINALGVISYALVNALGGLGHGMVNPGVHPIIGVILAMGALALGIVMGRSVRLPEPDATGLAKLATLRDAEAGKHRVRGTVERDGDTFTIADGDDRIAVELGTDRNPARGEERTPLVTFFGKLVGADSELVVEIVDEFEQVEGDYREAPDKTRRFVLQDGRSLLQHPWTHGRLKLVGARALQLGAIATGGLCVVELVT